MCQETTKQAESIFLYKDEILRSCCVEILMAECDGAVKYAVKCYSTYSDSMMTLFWEEYGLDTLKNGYVRP